MHCLRRLRLTLTPEFLKRVSAACALYTALLFFVNAVAVFRSPSFFSSKSTYTDYCGHTPVQPRQQWNSRKKVIAFSLFAPHEGNKEELSRSYLSGMLENVEAAKLFYPDWVVRVYLFDIPVALEAKLLRAENVEVVRCQESVMTRGSSSRKMMSRFLTYDSPDVMYTIVRDADSRLNPREMFAVNEWLSSGMDFHIMRDHEEHNVPVLGGMFGIKRGALNSSMSKLVTQAFDTNPSGIVGARGEDQSFLMKYIWPLVKVSTLAHDIDENRCTEFGSKICRNFPVPSQNKNGFFVGAAIRSDNNNDHGVPSLYTCSVDCVL